MKKEYIQPMAMTIHEPFMNVLRVAAGSDESSLHPSATTAAQRLASLGNTTVKSNLGSLGSVGSIRSIGTLK